MLHACAAHAWMLALYGFVGPGLLPARCLTRTDFTSAAVAGHRLGRADREAARCAVDAEREGRKGSRQFHRRVPRLGHGGCTVHRRPLVVRRLLITLVWPLFRHVRTACGIAQSRQTTRGPHARGWEQPRLHVTVQLEGPRRLPRGLRLSHEWPKPPLRCLQMAANLNVLGDRRRACECAPAGYAGIRDIMDHQTQGRAPPGGGAAAANVTSVSSGDPEFVGRLGRLGTLSFLLPL